MTGPSENANAPHVVSGIDWSGDAGDPARTPGSLPLLIFVAAHVNLASLPELADAMDEVRRARNLSERFAFRYSDCRPQVREAWFARLTAVPLAATALVIDKSGWDVEYLRRTTGDQRILAGLLGVVREMPAGHVAGQRLLIDYPPREKRKVEEIARAMNRTHRERGLATFAAIRPCPDDRRDGHIVQVADMIAGALRDRERDGRSYLSALGTRLRVFEE